MAQRIYKEWFVDFKYPGHENDELVDSELGMIPEGWEVKSYSEVAEFINGFAFGPNHWQKEGKPIIKINELKNGFTDTTSYYHGEDIAEKYHIENGDLLFSWSAHLDVYIWQSGEGLLNQHLFNVIPNKRFRKLFIFYALKYGIQEFRIRSQGTTMRHIKRSALNEVKLAIPTENQREYFSDIVNPISMQLQALRSKNENLRQTRDLLLPKLISGKVDVSDLDIDTSILDD
jgi:type I restriction enzyme S subunit